MANDIKRLNYFTGQFLEAVDFSDEQSYHIEMRRRLNASLRGPGILDGGFKVDIKNQSTDTAPAIITVGAGLGVDNLGQELVILSPLEKEIPLNDLNTYKGKTVAVYLGYQQVETDSKTSTDASGITRWTERPKITLQSAADSAPADMVRLENIIVDQNGQISITDKITLDKPDGVSITDKPVRQLASLWVDGNVGIGTKSPASKLEVSGTLKISGNGHIEVPSQTNENDAAIILGRSSGDPGSLFIVPKLGTGGYNGLSQEGDFGLFWRTNSKQDAGNLVIGPWNDTTAGIKITASGNVGIGTTNPERTLDIAGSIRGTGEIQTTSANAFRMVQGDYGLFLRNDGTNTYLLLTKAGDQYGNWNDLRPLSINNATGGVYLGNVGVNGDIAIDGKHALRGSDSWLRLNQDFAFSSGVHTPGLFAPKSLNVGGVGGWSNPGDGNATIAGNVSIGGEIQTTSANAFRMVQGNYGSFFRNDGSDTYLLLTNAGVPYGGWNDLRPLRINNASGGVYLGNLDVSDNFTATIRCGDFCMGHSSRRGTPGRALVDGSNTLHLNYGADWANVSIGGKVSTPSSRQLKENIQTLPSQLAKQIISTLEPVSFTYKHDSLKSQCLGFIAEDAPTEVASSNYDAIIMNHIVTALTRVVKDQEQTIAELAVQVNLLRNKNA